MKGPHIYNALSDEERVARLQRKAEKRIKEVRRVRRNRIVAVFGIAFLILGIQIAIMLTQTHRINSEVQASKSQLTKLNRENDRLDNQKNDLKDPDYLAKFARSKFLYSKPGEKVYNLPERTDDNQWDT